MRVFPCREHGAEAHNAGSRRERPSDLYPSTPAGSWGSTSNADPDATMRASPSGVTSSTEKPPASLAVITINEPLLARPDTRGT